MKVEDVMARDVATVSSETTLRDVARTLAEKQIAGVPVVDDERRVVGVVSEGDIVTKEAGPEPERGLLGWLLSGSGESKLEATTAGEAMTSPAVTIEPGREVAEAARLMTERDVNRLPVVEDGGALVGIVSRADLVRAFVRPDDELEREIREGVVLHTLWIDPSSIEISVREGQVTLTGEVDNKADAELVEYFTGRVPGVVAVRSDLSWRVGEPRIPSRDPRIPEPPAPLDRRPLAAPGAELPHLVAVPADGLRAPPPAAVLAPVVEREAAVRVVADLEPARVVPGELAR